MAAVAVTGARLIDGTGSDPVEGASVVVEDGRIAAAGRLGALPREARVIDLGGATVLPGLIDAHVQPRGG